MTYFSQKFAEFSKEKIVYPKFSQIFNTFGWFLGRRRKNAQLLKILENLVRYIYIQKLARCYEEAEIPCKHTEKSVQLATPYLREGCIWLVFTVLSYTHLDVRIRENPFLESSKSALEKFIGI